MTSIVLYVIFSVCSAHCRPAQAPQSGLLVFTSLTDCQAEAKELDDFEGKVTLFDGKTGKVVDPNGWRNTCVRSFFADYAQTERLFYGKVVCSYTTTMPESVMARTLDPYYTQTGKNACKPPKATR